MIKIDKGLPVVPNGAGAPSKYPTKFLEIGDSFFAAGAKQPSIASALFHYKPKKFVTRSVTENGVCGVRVWRTE